MSNWTSCCRLMLRSAAWLAMCLSFTAAAQTQPRYELHNTSSTKLTFATMDPARGTWKSQDILPNATKSFVWVSGAHQGRIRIGTEGRGYVEYLVEAGHRYAVVWDERKGTWDFRSRGMITAAATGNATTTSQAVNANARPPQGNPPHARTAAWTLNNPSNERLAFQTLDPSRGTWRDQVIYPHQPASYTMAPGVTSGRIRIATQNRGYVLYDVHAGGNYALHWNRDKGVWDLRSARAGG